MYDKDTERRGMYGKAGAFRPKPYGVEYRTLSNAWLSNDERISIQSEIDMLLGEETEYAVYEV